MEYPVPDPLKVDHINAVPGFISGLLIEYVSPSEYAIQPGTCIADDDETIITVDSTLTADITATGAGGRQSGLAEQASSWYELYVIADSEGNNPSAFLVEEGQTLSLPSGYDTHRRVGNVRNNAGSDFWRMHHRKTDRFIWHSGGEHEVLDTASPATSVTEISLSDHVPPDAEVAILRLIGEGDGSVAHQIASIRPTFAVNPLVDIAGWAEHGAVDARTVGYVELDDSQNVEYVTDNVSRLIIRVLGWIDER